MRDLESDHDYELTYDRPIISYCQVGQRGYMATRILLQHGFEARNLSGGMNTWILFASANQDVLR